MIAEIERVLNNDQCDLHAKKRHIEMLRASRTMITENNDWDYLYKKEKATMRALFESL